MDQPYSKSEQEHKLLEENYKVVIEENENLRIGMHEILLKIREYDGKLIKILNIF